MKANLHSARDGIKCGSDKSLAVTAWVMAEVLHKDNKLPADVTEQSDAEMSLQSGLLVDYDLQSVYQQAKKYVNE